MAIRENDSVEYKFNGESFIISVDEAKELIPKLINNSIANLEVIRNSFVKDFDRQIVELKDEFESLKSIYKI